MPSIHQHSSGSDVPDYEGLTNRFGENPANWVYKGQHTAIARLKGVRDDDFPDGVTAAEYVRAFRAVARQLNAPHTVMDVIERRLSVLEGEDS